MNFITENTELMVTLLTMTLTWILGFISKGEDSVGIESLSTESIAEAGYFLR